MENKAQDSRERIKIVALNLFANQGFETVSIRDIAQKAKINSSMISYYFEGKDNLLMELIEDQNRTNEQINENIKRISNPYQQLLFLFQEYVSTNLKNWQIFKIIRQEMNKNNKSEFELNILHSYMLYSNNIKLILKNGIHQKVFKVYPENFICHLILGTCNEFIDDVINSTQKLSKPDQQHYLCDFELFQKNILDQLLLIPKA